MNSRPASVTFVWYPTVPDHQWKTSASSQHAPSNYELASSSALSGLPLVVTSVSYVPLVDGGLFFLRQSQSKLAVTTQRCELSHLTSANPPPLRPPLTRDHIPSATWSYTNCTSHSSRNVHTSKISAHRMLSAWIVFTINFTSLRSGLPLTHTSQLEETSEL